MENSENGHQQAANQLFDARGKKNVDGVVIEFSKDLIITPAGTRWPKEQFLSGYGPIEGKSPEQIVSQMFSKFREICGGGWCKKHLGYLPESGR